MSLGNDLYSARKKSGLSQEEAAEKTGVSRRTVSEYELVQSLPDVFQAKRLARL